MNEISRAARKALLNLAYETQSPHVGSSLSMIDIVSAVLTYSTNRLETHATKDDIILSKGHAAAGFYSVLYAMKLITLEQFNSYYKNGSDFYGHISHKSTEWSALSTGSLGHGLPFAVGLSLANRILGDHETDSIVIMSDGECDEGSIWESALIANHNKLHKLKIVIDRNRLQSIKGTEETLELEPFRQKWESFGWNVLVVDGHSHSELSLALNSKSTEPTCIIAETTKGKGVTFMENEILWHYKAPNQSEFSLADSELDRN